MNKKMVFIGAGIMLALMAVYFPFHGYLEKRQLSRTTLEILNNWKNNDVNANYRYWKEPTNCPPIFGLNSYKILKEVFGMKGEFPSLEVHMLLDFPEDNLLPANKIWILEYHNFKRLGWMVVDFRLADQ